MRPIVQDDIYALISDINTFAENSENLINAVQSKNKSEREALLNRHSAALSQMERQYIANCDAISSKSNSTITEAKRILADVEKLEAKLRSVDKYFEKTIIKKQDGLKAVTSEKYSNAEDYFSTLDNIKRDYNALMHKYADDVLPAIINGLNYMFSGKRKKDYEELIVLKNTVNAFVDEIQTELPPITNETLTNLKNTYFKNVTAEKEHQKYEIETFDNRYSATLEALADKLCAQLEEIVPDGFVEYLYGLMENHKAVQSKINSGNEIVDGVLNMSYVDYPVDFFVQSPIVASLIKNVCGKLLVNNSIRLPLIMSTEDSPAWMIIGDNSNITAVQHFTHSLMFNMLSSVPVSKLEFSVIDPENRGNSISAFFDAKKKMPELFSDKICISKEDTLSKINSLNEYIEDILQDKLGNQYENIFDYARDHEDYDYKVKPLIIYDFPKSFDEQSIAGLRNVLRNGRRCGIVTIISYTPDNDGSMRSTEFLNSLKSIEDLSKSVYQNNETFILNGLPVLYVPMPEKVEFSQFFGKYMLIFEGLQNRGIAFSPMVKKLLDCKDEGDLERHIGYIGSIVDEYNSSYAKVPAVDKRFEENLTLGTVYYPADVFSDSSGYEKILNAFGKGNHVELPLMVNMKNPFNLLLRCNESNMADMVSFTHHVIWSMFTYIPVTKANICIFDAEQRGNSVIPFLDFRKKMPDLFDQQIYTNQEAIYDKLKKLNSQIDEFIQEKLGNRYDDIIDYNINTPKRAETVTLLVLYDFPSAFDGRCVDLLINILRNGSKCGIYAVICHNENVVYSKYDSIDEKLEIISKYALTIDHKDKKLLLQPYNLQIEIPALPDYNATDTFISEYKEISEVLKKQGLSFTDILDKNLFERDSSKEMTIPIGVGDGDSIVSLTLGTGSSHHALIAGATGSGKSTLLHTLIMSTMLHYSPDQVHLYLMDFKSGTEFKVYESVKLPHIKLLALDAMQEFGESILEKLVQEMENRGSIFKSVGQTSIKGYVQATGKPMPRILVIMDEFQILFNIASNRKIANNCAELAKRIVTEGRAFGIHLLMSTQSTKVIYDLSLSNGTLEQMRIRIGLKCGEDDARYMFSDRNDDKALEMMKGPIGTAVMNLEYMESDNIGLRVAYCDSKTQAMYLNEISERFKDEPYTLQTFEGARTVGLIDYFTSQNITITDQLPVNIHMGNLIKVAPPFSDVIDSKRRHNLLVCGASEKMSNNITDSYMLNALLNTNTKVYCIDGNVIVGDSVSDDVYSSFSMFSERFRKADTRGDIIRMINEIYDEYLERKMKGNAGIIFVVIKNLQFLDIVNTMLKGESITESEYLPKQEEPVVQGTNLLQNDGSDDGPFAGILNMNLGLINDMVSDSELNVTNKLMALLKDGYTYGISFVLSSTEYQTVKESMSYSSIGESALSRFPERIIFSLNELEAERLIDGVSVAGLRDNTVYYTDGVKNTFQLKPYVMPSADELKAFVSECVKGDNV